MKTPMPKPTTSKHPDQRRPRKWVRRYPSARFEFLDWNSRRPKRPIRRVGTVTVTRGRMVFEVNGLDGRPCVVAGSRRQGVFGGRSQTGSRRVLAKWFRTEFVDVWLGAWIVNGKDHLFMVDLHPGKGSYSIRNLDDIAPDDFEQLEKLPELREKFKKIEESASYREEMAEFTRYLDREFEGQAEIIAEALSKVPEADRAIKLDGAKIRKRKRK